MEMSTTTNLQLRRFTARAGAFSLLPLSFSLPRFSPIVFRRRYPLTEPYPSSLRLDGVELLPSEDSPAVTHHLAKAPKGTNSASSAMAKSIKQTFDQTGKKTWVVVTGPCTNAAAFMKESEDVVRECVEGWVVMGGAFGERALFALLVDVFAQQQLTSSFLLFPQESPNGPRSPSSVSLLVLSSCRAPETDQVVPACAQTSTPTPQPCKLSSARTLSHLSSSTPST